MATLGASDFAEWLRGVVLVQAATERNVDAVRWITNELERYPERREVPRDRKSIFEHKNRKSPIEEINYDLIWR